MSSCRWWSRVTGELETVSWWHFERLRARWENGEAVYAEDEWECTNAS